MQAGQSRIGNLAPAIVPRSRFKRRLAAKKLGDMFGAVWHYDSGEG